MKRLIKIEFFRLIKMPRISQGRFPATWFYVSVLRNAFTNFVRSISNTETNDPGNFVAFTF